MVNKLLAEDAKVRAADANPASGSAQDALESCSSDDATRRSALARSIATWLPDLSLAELERIDATLTEVLRDRDQSWWARHNASQEWHLVVEVAGGSVVIACNGRWSLLDKFETESRPARADRCVACQRMYEAQRLMLVGLRELRDAKPAVMPSRHEVQR